MTGVQTCALPISYDSGKQKRVFIQDTWDEVAVAVISKNSKVRVRGGVKSPIITDAVKGEEVIVLETMERWSKVVTQDGHIGYMPGRRLAGLTAEKPVSSFRAPEYRNISLDEKIILVWHQVTLEAANGVLDELMAQTKGINVIAPTWFTLSDNEGNYESLADRSDGVVPLAAALQQALAKCFHIFLGNRAGACVLQLDFHKVVLQYDSICLLAGFYKPIVVDAQRGQVVVDGLGTVTPDVTHIGNVFQHVGPVELTWALAKCLLAPPKILRDVLAVN